MEDENSGESNEMEVRDFVLNKKTKISFVEGEKFRNRNNSVGS